MAENRGKDFEKVVRGCFERVPGVSVDRLHDQTTGYAGSSNIADFIIYRKPTLLYIECKSVHGNTLSINSNDPKRRYGNISNRQWEGLLEKSKIPGVIAGVMCWWVDKDVTRFIPIKTLQYLRNTGSKSLSYKSLLSFGDDFQYEIFELLGKKKRVFFDYDMEAFLDGVSTPL